MPNQRSQEQAEYEYSEENFGDGMFEFRGYHVSYDPMPDEIPAEIPVEIPDEIYTELFKKCSQLRSEILDHISGDETLEIYQKVQSFLLTERTFEKDIIGIMFDDIELEEGENNFIVTKLLQAYIIDLDLKSQEDVKRILHPYSKLEDSKLEDSKLEDSKLEDSKLKDSKLKDSKLKDSKLKDSKLKDSKLEDSKLEDSKLEEDVALEPDIKKPPVFTTKSTPAPVVREAIQKSCWQRFTDLFQCC